MTQDNELTRDQLQDAAEQARQAADAAQAAANNALENATVAQSSADQAGAIADTLFNVAENFGGPSDFIYLFAIFALAIFVGYYVVWSVTPALHTPLMSVTNAISSVVIVGALLAVGADLTSAGAGGGFVSKLLGFLAIILASVNIFGGFLVTERMLAMYKKKDK